MAIPVWAPVPVGAVARWALIGVVAAAIIVRLRGGSFAGWPGAALIAIGGAALIFLCGAVRREGWGTEGGRSRSVASHLPGSEQVFFVGTVVPGSITSWPGTREHFFAIKDSSSSPPAVILARYVGGLPDGFESGGAVLLHGTLTIHGWDQVLDVVPGGITTGRDR